MKLVNKVYELYFAVRILFQLILIKLIVDLLLLLCRNAININNKEQNLKIQYNIHAKTIIYMSISICEFLCETRNNL